MRDGLWSHGLSRCLRARGLEGLRVIDTSIMPEIITGNLNSPTIMLAAKLADVISSRNALPVANVPIFIQPTH